MRFLDTDASTAIGAAKKSGVKRFLVVGGAGSLEVAPGSALIDTPNFPAAYKPEASGGRDFLNVLKTEREPRLDLPISLVLSSARASAPASFASVTTRC